MTKEFKNPKDSTEVRQALLKQIAASNLSKAVKDRLTIDINNDDPVKFMVDSNDGEGLNLDQIVAA